MPLPGSDSLCPRWSEKPHRFISPFSLKAINSHLCLCAPRKEKHRKQRTLDDDPIAIEFLSMSRAAVGYNERCFRSGSLRSRYHLNRFFWLQTQLQRLPSSPKRIIELGCYDGRSLDFLPAQPDYYLGLDAGWEGGLAIGQKKFADARHIDLRLCQKPGDIPMTWQNPICVGSGQ